MTAPRTQFGMYEKVGMSRPNAKSMTAPAIVIFRFDYNAKFCWCLFVKVETVEEVGELGPGSAGRHDRAPGEGGGERERTEERADYRTES